MLCPEQDNKRLPRTRLGLLAVAGLAQLQIATAQQPFPLLGPEEMTVATTCSALEELELPELAGVSSQWNREGTAEIPELAADPESPELAAHCRVRGRIDPSIVFEVWLPAPESWNGRFLAVGGSGTAGNLSYGRMASALNQGYASASTDTGHTSAIGEVA